MLAGCDTRVIEALLDATFGEERHGRTAYRIRLGMAWLTDLSLAARDEDGALIGLVQSWPVALHVSDDQGAQGDDRNLVMVGPVAVAPHLQTRGFGRMLMDRLIEMVDSQACPPLMMIGDPDYYGRFWGFEAGPTAGWSVPGPVERHRLLVRYGRAAPLPLSGALGPRRSIVLTAI